MPGGGVPFRTGHDPRRNTDAILRPGHAKRWMPGQSGNPRGTTATRAKFQECYVQCLAGGQGDEELLARAKELSDLAWKAARAGESWGFQEVRGQLAPLIAQAQVKLVREAEHTDVNLALLNDEQLEQFIALSELASGPVIEIEGEVVEERPAAESEPAPEEQQ